MLSSNCFTSSDSFESGEIKTMQWVNGKQNFADVLTKRNVVIFRKLNEFMSTVSSNPEILRHAKRIKGDAHSEGRNMIKLFVTPHQTIRSSSEGPSHYLALLKVSTFVHDGSQ